MIMLHPKREEELVQILQERHPLLVFTTLFLITAGWTILVFAALWLIATLTN